MLQQVNVFVEGQLEQIKLPPGLINRIQWEIFWQE